MWLYVLCSLVGVSGLVVRDQFSVPEEDTPAVIEANTRIKGGFPINITFFPYTVQYVVKQRFCAGVIVDKKHILTAANCVDKATPDMISLRTGSGVRGAGTKTPIADVLLHPEYRGDNEKDIAILITKRRINFSAFMKPVAIVPENQMNPNNVVVVGWGEDGSGSGLSSSVMDTRVELISNEECEAFFGDLVSEDTFCTDFERGREGPCKGDEGGPAVKDGVLYGIISVTSFCGRGGFPIPSLYTAIAGPSIHRFVTENTDAREAMD